MNRKERLFSLDLLRGADMFLLTVIGPLVWAAHAAWKLPDGFLFQFTHPWEGFTLWDIIMPLFLFMCGAAVPFSLEKRLANGRANAGYWKHVALRVALLWVLGMLVQGHLAELDPLELRPYNNTLQTIAAGYLITACVIRVPSWKFRIAVPAVSFALYALLLHFLGDYTPAGNFAETVEQKLLAAVMPAGSKAVRELGVIGFLETGGAVGEIHYTWWLTTLMFGFMTMCGYFASKILLASENRRLNARRLFVFGAGLLGLGWLLVPCGVKMVKHIFTASFTAQAMGWSTLALAVAYWFTDVLMFRRGLGIFVLFGRASLVAYLIGEFFWPCFLFAGDFLTRGFVRLVGKPVQGVIACLAAIVLLVLCLVVRRRLAACAAIGKGETK